jgi:DNA adenine methylase
MTVANDVRKWCIDRGKDKRYRIVLAGYEGEHEELLNHGWVAHAWTAGGGYSKTGHSENENRKKEILWVSPHCLREATLFDGLSE